MKLYHFEGSPFGWMARTALAEKGLAYEAVEPKDRDKNPELKALNPLNRTPTLVDGDKALFESWAILEYLDEKYPVPPLMPRDPADRAHARAMALLAYLYIFPENRTAVLQLFDWSGWDSKVQPYPARRPAEKVDRSILDPAEERLLGHYKVLDQELSRRPWASGEAFGLADIVLMTAAAGYRLRGGPVTELPNVLRWLDACLDRRAVRESATPLIKRGQPV